MELSERKQLIRAYLLRTRAELLEVVGQLQPDDWNKAVQSSEGGWTVKQALLHTALSETGQIKTGKAIAAGQPTVPDDFDLNRYNKRQQEKNSDKQLPEILSGMAQSRQLLLAYLDEVTAADLEKRGRHGRGDVISLEQLFYRIGEHEAEHTGEIKAAVKP